MKKYKKISFIFALASLLIMKTAQGSENKQLPYQLTFGSDSSDQDLQDDDFIDIRPRSLLPDMDGKTALVITPYPYSVITDDQRATTTYVPESCYVVLPEGCPITQAVVGPTCPCIGLAMQNILTKKLVIMHKNSGNTDTALLKILQNEFLETPSDHLRFTAFTCGMANQSKERHDAHIALFETTIQKIRESFSNLKDHAIKRTFYTPPLQTGYAGNYAESDKWIKITSEGFFCISPYNEKILYPEIISKRDFHNLRAERIRESIGRLDYIMKCLLPSDHPLITRKLHEEHELIKIDPAILLLARIHTIKGTSL